MNEVQLTQEEVKKVVLALEDARQCIEEQVDKVKALELQVDVLTKAGDWMSEKLDKIAAAARSVDGDALLKALAMEPPKIEKPVREGDGHLCIAAEGVPCSLCGRITLKQECGCLVMDVHRDDCALKRYCERDTHCTLEVGHVGKCALQ